MESGKAQRLAGTRLSSHPSSDKAIAGRRTSVKIESVEIDNRRAEFRIAARGKEWLFPYSKLRLKPSLDNRIAEAYPEPETGNEAFTYRLQSGEEDTIHLDNVLSLNRDPETMVGLILHNLTVEAIEGVEESGLGIRQLSRMMDTSPAQVYRLLDTTNYAKSLGQMIYLLHLVGKDVDVVVTPAA